MKQSFFWMMIALLATSCSSILNTTYQRVTIQTPPNSQLLLNGEEPETKNGKYLLRRNGSPKQLTIRQEGKMDAHFMVAQYHKSPLYALSLATSGALILNAILKREEWTQGGEDVTSLVLAGGGVLMAEFDRFARAFDYPSKITLRATPYDDIPDHTEERKRIFVDKISFDLQAEDIEYRIISYKTSVKNEKKAEATSYRRSRRDNIVVDNTIFSNSINEILKEEGYIDTTNKALKNSYSNNLSLNATIRGVKITSMMGREDGVILSYFVDLTVEWELFDYYNTSVLTFQTETRSGQFLSKNPRPNKKGEKQEEYDPFKLAIKHALELGLSKAFSDPKAEEVISMTGPSAGDESLSTLELPQAQSYVANHTPRQK